MPQRLVGERSLRILGVEEVEDGAGMVCRCRAGSGRVEESRGIEIGDGGGALTEFPVK